MLQRIPRQFLCIATAATIVAGCGGSSATPGLPVRLSGGASDTTIVNSSASMPTPLPTLPALQCAMNAGERDTTCVLFNPSIVELLARPELYDGKRVRVTGFVDLEFEGNAVYLSREDYSQMSLRNGLWLEVSDTLARRSHDRLPGYFLVEGRFNRRDRGHLGMWSGAIDSVTRLEPSISRADIDRAVKRARSATSR